MESERGRGERYRREGVGREREIDRGRGEWGRDRFRGGREMQRERWGGGLEIMGDIRRRDTGMGERREGMLEIATEREWERERERKRATGDR